MTAGDVIRYLLLIMDDFSRMLKNAYINYVDGNISTIILLQMCALFITTPASAATLASHHRSILAL